MCGKPIFKKVIDFEEVKQLLEQMRRDRGFPSGYKDWDDNTGRFIERVRINEG
jgi:hypothetical protein